ncbi:MAG: C10 family peptidase [Muribaculaceae bacterium]|nr:C10 family peptidase [Muribaculaceae bacterium]
MKRIYLSVLLAAMGAVAAHAERLSAAQAQGVAEQFVQSRMMRQAPGRAADNQLSLAHEATSPEGLPDYYVFNRGTDGGYILVAGDDASLPVLGFVDGGTFCLDSLPPNALWWLGELQREVQYARQQGTAPRQMPMLSTSVAPIVKTVWDQGTPYNNECPTFNGGNNRAVTGCVATAVAQIMKVHAWPPVGEGSVTYDCNVNGEPATTLSADFSQIHFDWSAMRDNYSMGRSSEGQKHAVAQLMSAVGIATEMMYGASSGTHSIKAFNALRDYFRYDTGMTFRLRDFMPLDEWEQLIRSELDAGRPIYYAGQSDASGGHAFLIDGYNKNNYFHLNWGWGGRSDGYFAVSALNPSAVGGGGFNSGQEAIMGIQPYQGGTAVTQPLQGYLADFGTKVASARLGDEVPLSMINFTFLGEGEMDMVDFEVAVMNESGTNQEALLHITTDEVWKGYTYYFSDSEPISITLPDSLSDGTYRLVAMYSLDSLATVQPFVRKADSAGYVLMTVTDGTAVFDNHVVPVGVAELCSLLEPVAVSMPADDVQGQALVKSAGGIYSGTLKMVVMRKNALGAYDRLALASTPVAFNHTGEQAVVTFTTQVEAAKDDTCYMALIDPLTDASMWTDPVPFVIGNWPDPVPAIVTPEGETRIDFGSIVTNQTYVEQLNVQGENLKGSLTLAIIGRDADRFGVTPATISQANALHGVKVSVKYLALTLGNHEAQLIISGGGLEQPVVVDLFGASYYRGDLNEDDVVDVADANVLINIILRKHPNNMPKLADFNNDKVVDVADLNMLVDILLHKSN